jgi:hypothetical protein
MDVDEMTTEHAACLGALCVQISTTIHDATHAHFFTVMWHVQYKLLLGSEF